MKQSIFFNKHGFRLLKLHINRSTEVKFFGSKRKRKKYPKTVVVFLDRRVSGRRNLNKIFSVTFFFFTFSPVVHLTCIGTTHIDFQKEPGGLYRDFSWRWRERIAILARSSCFIFLVRAGREKSAFFHGPHSCRAGRFRRQTTETARKRK